MLLAPGVEYASVSFAPTFHLADHTLHLVRVDPRVASVRALLASEHGAARTAGQWCRDFHCAVAINLGMYATDGMTNVGYLRNGSHRNNPRWNAYKAALGLSPRSSASAPLRWIDLDREPSTALKDYTLVVQNLRLIKAPRTVVAMPSARRWSEAALALDGSGRLLFAFSRTPLSLREFGNLVLSLPLDVVQAMHLEGGPEASLSIHTPRLTLDLCGSYETGFRLNDTNDAQEPIPNVLGVSIAEK
jgi:hypothetical protein